MPSYAAVVNLVLVRARRLGFKNQETGLPDGADCELAVYEALLDLLGKYDIDGFTVINTAMFTTGAGLDSYDLPTDFGRFISPIDRDRFGFALNDGQHDSPLIYRMPDEWLRLKATYTGKSRYFTITDQRKVRLDPAPDANNGSNYTAKGVYVRDVPPEELDEALVPLSFAMCLKDMALAQMAEDLGSPTAAMLVPTAARSITALVNNQARQQTRFKRPYTEVGRSSRNWRL